MSPPLKSALERLSPIKRARLLIIAGIVVALVLTQCEFRTVQKQFKLVERWSSRWCGDQTHEQLDRCKTSDGLNKLYGAVGALGGGNGSPPLRIDRAAATQACMDADSNAIYDLNSMLEKGAKVVVRGEQMTNYSARTQPQDGQKDYHLVDCLYRLVILEGPARVLTTE